MLNRLPILLLMLLLPVSAVLAQGDDPDVLTFYFDDLERSYVLHVPAGLTDPAPVVIVLHGRGGTGVGLGAYTGFDDLADREGFITLYPSAIDGEWNYPKGILGYDVIHDDTAFLTALVDHIAAEYPVDRSRVYVAGFSNGGFMVQRIACENNTQFAAYASVAASGFGGMLDVCDSSGQSPMLLMHGTLDNNILWEGVSVTRGTSTVYVTYPVPQTLAYWAEFNACAPESETTAVPQSGQSPGTRVRILTVDCPADASVVLYIIDGGGHNWPGREPSFSRAIAGNVNMDINAAVVIWQFFAAHHRESAAGVTPESSASTGG